MDLQNPRQILTGGVNSNAGTAQMISRLILHGDMAQRLLNIEVAAMHLGFLLKVKKIYACEVPTMTSHHQGNADLPAKTVDLLAEISFVPTTHPLQTPKLIQNSSDAPLDPLDEARIIKDAPTTQPLRLPLHIALFVSPIFLLAPINLHNRDWDRTSLFQVC